MSEKPVTTIRPSKIAITKMLAELESTRKLATKRWQLALLLPLVVGAALIGFTGREVRKNLKERDALAIEKSALKDEIVTLEVRKAELTKEKDDLALTVNRIETVVEDAKKKGEDLGSVQNQVRNIIDSSATIEKSTPRVVIHIHDEDQRAKAVQVTQALKKSGFSVPDVEIRPEKIENNQVRFFRQEDRVTAERVAGILADQGVKDVKLTLLYVHRAPPDQIEIWLTATSTPGADAGEQRIVLQQRGDISIIRIHGQLTGDTPSVFRSLLAGQRRQGLRKFLVDLGDVSAIDDQGINALVSEYTATGRVGGQLKLLNVAKTLKDLLSITKLLTVFDCYDNEAEAISSFGE